jgi:signal transduction histidine kinase
VNDHVSALSAGIPHLFQGGGEMSGRMRSFDWTHSPLGATQDWSPSLRTAVNVCLTSAFPLIVLWGEDLVQLYNDAYRDVMGVKHPAGLGQPTRECWPEVWDFNEPIYRQVREQGETLTFTDQRLVLQRLGREEEAFFSLGYSPIWDEVGAVGGVLVTVLETTRQVLAERRLGEKQAELTQQNMALEQFARLTRELTTSTDPATLIRGAQEIVLGLLPPGFAVHWELHGQTWRIASQVGELYLPELQAIMDAGIPYAAGQNNVIPWESRRPYYLDQYDPNEDDLAARATQVSTTASLPVFTNGQVAGIFGIGLFDPVAWTPAHKAVMETVARVLGEALERSQQAREAEEERAALSAFMAFTEQVGTQTDVLDLARQAIEVLNVRFPETAIGYYQPFGEVWKLRAWNDAIPEDVLKVVTAGVSSDTPMLSQALRTRTLVFTAAWDAEYEHIEHTEIYGAVVTFPMLIQGEVVGLLSMGVPGLSQRQWSEQDRTIRVMRSVGQSFQLALERSVLVMQLLEQRALLESANEELSSFSYSVSHDLRTPVRHIIGFAGILRKTIEAHLDDRSRHQLGVIDSAARQLDGLIDALLDLSRTARRPMRLRLTDLTLLVTRARLDVAPDQVGRDVKWQVGPLPEVLVDPETLQKAIGNLVSNAVKFTKAREQAVIEIWAEEHSREWRFFIRDNGVGFDPKYQDKLFGVFQKLHSHNELGGTGVGLANVRRIVHRHGGQVWAEGTIGQGATFGFSLPRLGERLLAENHSGGQGTARGEP